MPNILASDVVYGHAEMKGTASAMSAVRGFYLQVKDNVYQDNTLSWTFQLALT
jgi:hypothetical protein